jgi:hypothetical protein
MTATNPLQWVAWAIAIAGGSVGLLSPLIQFKSRSDLNSYRLTRLEDAVEKLTAHIEELRKELKP